MTESVCPLCDGNGRMIVPERCEVLDPASPSGICGEDAAWFYPAMGGGIMRLCEKHAEKHRPYVSPLAAASPPEAAPNE